MDYRDFLLRERRVLRLPYARERKVWEGVQVWRLREELTPGWYRFASSGRFLDPIEEIDSEIFAWERPALRGYLAQGRFVGESVMAPLHGLVEDLPRYTPLIARQWFDGSLWFEMADFESAAEEAVRRAFEEEQGISRIKGVPPALAQAYFLDHTARVLAREAERRRQEAAVEAQRAVERARWEASLEGRIALALSHANAQLLDWRQSGRSRATVRYRLQGHRFECVVATDTLQIVDAGICLEGEDRQLSLSSLPSAVREAISTGQLHVW